MESNRIEKLLENRTLYYFYQVSQIPRGSGNEKAISDFVYRWAEERKLWVRQDSFGNLVIKKQGTEGKKDSAPVLLQAHLDMVCVKSPDSSHDFMKEGIPWKVEGDWILSASGTSLGADCGIGLALIMAILESDTCVHPPLEVILTVREETDMAGAYHIDGKEFQSKRMINLDTSPDTRILAGSCGGIKAELRIPVQWEKVTQAGYTYEICIQGLMGGHSGLDIDKGRGNAILLAGRILHDVLQEIPSARAAGLQGGTYPAAIPREAKLSIWTEDRENAAEILTKCKEKLEHEYKNDFPEFKVEWSLLKETDCVMSRETTYRTAAALMLMPNGIQEMKAGMTGVVESSSSLGLAVQEEESFVFISEIRNIYSSTKEELVEKQRVLAGILGGSLKTYDEYPSWEYKTDSRLRDLIQEVYKARNGKSMEVEVVHAGNEIGVLQESLGNVDAAAMGPTRPYNHSPSERLSISSSIEFEKFLFEILEKMD